MIIELKNGRKETYPDDCMLNNVTLSKAFICVQQRKSETEVANLALIPITEIAGIYFRKEDE